MGYLRGTLRFPSPSPSPCGLRGEEAINGLYPGTRYAGQSPPPALSPVWGSLRLGVSPAYCYRLAGPENPACGFVMSVPPDKSVRLNTGVLSVRTGIRASFSSESLRKVGGTFIRGARFSGAATTDRIFRSRDPNQRGHGFAILAPKKFPRKFFAWLQRGVRAGSSL
jgi:hypothetical protein